MGLAWLEQNDKADKVRLIWPSVDPSSSLFPTEAWCPRAAFPLSDSAEEDTVVTASSGGEASTFRDGSVFTEGRTGRCLTHCHP